MGEKSPLVWFSLRRVDCAWRCIVWRNTAAVFVSYGSNRDELWAQAWQHMLAVQDVAL